MLLECKVMLLLLPSRTCGAKKVTLLLHVAVNHTP
jgi:hypothetical protein